MAGFQKYESILKLFSSDRSMWTVADIAQARGLSTSTAYRLVRELTLAGFVESTVDSRYRLGPAFVEFDRIVRETDPVVGQASRVLPSLVDTAPLPAAVVLCRLYGNRVMCVADARSSAFLAQTSYQRGCPMPITRGATSKAILASLDRRRRERLLSSLEEDQDFAGHALGSVLNQVRKAGYCITRGEVDPGLCGIAAPVLNAHLGIAASLSVVVNAPELTPDLETELISLVVASASHLTTALARTYDGPDEA